MKKELILAFLSGFVLTACNSGGGPSSTTSGSSINSQDAAQTSNCISITKFTPTIGLWWVSGTFNINNSCSTMQTVSNLQLLLTADQLLTAANFSLSNISLTPWASVTASAVAQSGNANAILITLITGGTIAANGSAAGSFGYNPNGVVLSG